MSDDTSGRYLWVYVLIAAIVALAVGFGAAWMVQAQKVSDAKTALRLAEAKVALQQQDLTESTKALNSAIAERDKLALAAAEASSTSTTAAGSTVTTTLRPPKPAGFTGKVCGYIKKFTKKGGTTSVTMDQIQFFTGTAAAAAATAHGDESPPPNDYYIVNDSPKLRTYPLAKTVKVTMTTAVDNLYADGYSTTLTKLTGAFSGAEPGLSNAKGSPYWFTVKNGVVTAIREQYLP